VKNSTSDLLVTNCDEFIFYDDLVREKKKAAPRRSAKTPAKRKASAKADEAVETPAASDAPARKSDEERRDEVIDLIVSTTEALAQERGADKIWGSMVKQALKRRKPGFNESFYGFRSFNAMLEAASQAGQLSLDRDEKSGGYLVRLAASED
jgi:hypothetical protein